ncbi:hypothetical protein D3C76_1459170 [compost metagenome]
MVLHVMALPMVGVEQQIRIARQQRQGFAQLLQALGQALQVGLGVAGQGDLQVGVASVVDQFETDIGLLHLPGLAHLGVVETHESRGLGGITQGELFLLMQRIAQPVDQHLECLGLIIDGAHIRHPPQTHQRC